jgi:carboxymethylenebutenolidase
MKERLSKAGVEFEFHTYPGTEHWFFERDREEAFNLEAAALAWERTIRFLRERLGRGIGDWQ